MEALALYALKTGGCLAVFYLFFKLLLSRETLHRFNRLLLLQALVLAFVLPLCVITVTREVPAAPMPARPLLLPAEAAEPLPAAEAPFDWGRLLGGIYLAGVAAMLLATALSVGRVVRMIRRGRCETLPDGWRLVRLPQATVPFSWWRYVVIPEEEPAEGFEQILVHETAHLRLRHSLDLLLTDVAGCLQWFNPAMWLLRRELRAIHEYEADEAVLDSGADARQYQIMLIKKAAGRRWYSVANSFNHSNLKNRITMMLQKRSSRWARAKALVAVPLVCAALGAFARTVEVPVEDKSSKNSVSEEFFAENSWQTPLPAAAPVPSPAPVPRQAPNPGQPAAKRTQPQRPEGQTTLRLHVADAATGDALAGVIVKRTDSDQGTVTDAQGRAMLRVSDPATVELQQVGYRTVQIRMEGGTTQMNGRGSIRSELGGGQGPVTTIGVRMQAETEAPAASAASEVSEVSEVSAEDPTAAGLLTQPRPAAEQPLYLVDDEPAAEIGSLDPQRIESISVLKAPETVAPYLEKYGDRAKNGVVVVRLKPSAAAPQPSYFERDEWKQAQEQVAQVAGSFQSKEWKAAQKRMKKMRKQFAAQKEQFAMSVEKFKQMKSDFEARKAQFEARQQQFLEQQAQSGRQPAE